MRIWVGPFNFSNQAFVLADALRKRGVDITLGIYDTPGARKLRFEAHEILPYGRTHGKEAITNMLNSIKMLIERDYDIYHFYWRTLYCPFHYENFMGIDLPFLKSRQKKIVYRFTGNDLRTKSRAIENEPFTFFKYGFDMPYDEEAIVAYVEFLKEYVDMFVVQDPELAQYLPEATIVPRALHIKDWKNVGVDLSPTKIPLIVHAPTNRIIKGSDIIERAIAELRSDGYVFEYITFGDLPHQQAIEQYKRADICIDNIHHGCPGVFSLECMALGKPVIVYVRQDLYEPVFGKVPIENTNPLTIKDSIRVLLDDPQRRQDLGQAGRAFVERNHDVDVVADRMLLVYRQVMDAPVKRPTGVRDIDYLLKTLPDDAKAGASTRSGATAALRLGKTAASLGAGNAVVPAASAASITTLPVPIRTMSAEALMDARILEWLNGYKAEPPLNNYALNYAKSCYSVGLGYCRRLFRALGWTGRRQGLDVGSGAGHWTIAFAFDNEQATGVEPNESYIRLASGAAAQVGLTTRVRHVVGRAEALEFADDYFDTAWSNNVLHFCELEPAIHEITRVLDLGGQFYCSYPSIGYRLRGIYLAVLTQREDLLNSHLVNYLAGGLRCDGIAKMPWRPIHFLSMADLLTVCRSFGLTCLGSPGLPDGAKDFAGIPANIDFLCVKDGDRAAFRDELLNMSPVDARGRARYHELIRIGLGGLVQSVFDERGDRLSDPEIGTLYSLAGLRAGRIDVTQAPTGGGVDPLVQGLLAWNSGQASDALYALRALPLNHPDRNFLLGAALLCASEPEAAALEFERGIEARRRPIECEFGAMLARLKVAGWPEQRKRMLRALHALPSVLGASDSAVAKLAAALTDTTAAGKTS